MFVLIFALVNKTKGKVMNDIPNDAYITVKMVSDSVVGTFIGDKPTQYYLGQKIIGLDEIQGDFTFLKQQLVKNVEELHILSSVTSGDYAQPGNPVPKSGKYSWGRVKFVDGTLGNFVFSYEHEDVTSCAQQCVAMCGRAAWRLDHFKNSLLRPAK